METIIIQAEPEKIKALKAFLKAFHIPFEVKKGEKPYDPEFVNKVKEAETAYMSGDFKRVESVDELKSLLLDE